MDDKKKSSIQVSKITRLRLRKMSEKSGSKMIRLADEAIQKFMEERVDKKINVK